MGMEDLIMTILLIFSAPFLSYVLIELIERNFLANENVFIQLLGNFWILICSFIMLPFIVVIFIFKLKSNWFQGTKRHYSSLFELSYNGK